MRLMKFALALGFVGILIVPTIGCGPKQIGSPLTAEEEAKQEAYYKALDEAQAKGIDPATVPAPN